MIKNVKKNIKRVLISIFGENNFEFIYLLLKKPSNIKSARDKEIIPLKWLLIKYYEKFKLKKDLNFNENLSNNLSFDLKRIRSLLMKFNIDYYNKKFSWHWHIFSNFSTEKKLNILEIGTLDGKFSNFLSKIFPNSQIVTVDLPDNNLQFIDTYNRKTPEIFNKILKERKENLNKKNIRFIQLDSFYLLNQLEHDYFDFVWIDGDHLNPQVTFDIFQALKFCKKGGVICVDDIVKVPLKNDYVSNDSYLTLENLNSRNILKSYYFIKNITVFNIYFKKYVSFSIKK